MSQTQAFRSDFQFYFIHVGTFPLDFALKFKNENFLYDKEKINSITLQIYLTAISK